MGGFDINAMTSFLRGYTEEQERQASEKKINSALRDKNAKVNMRVDPMTGKPTYTVEFFNPQEQALKKAQLEATQARTEATKARSQAGSGSAVKVIGNNLVRYDAQTGQAVPIYTAPASKKLFTSITGAVYEYDSKAGSSRMIMDESGQPVSQQQSQPEPQTLPGQAPTAEPGLFEQYKQKYPDRSDEEIRAAMGRQGLK